MIERLGIEAIASYIPGKGLSNFERKEKFAIDDRFIEEKLGVRRVALKDDAEEASDLCIRAFEILSGKLPIEKKDIGAVIVVTQNPDTNIPHTSAIVHGKLDLAEQCACFDVSLGCSGFVYGLSIIQSFMKENRIGKGLLFTADPYSKIIDRDDKNTALLFGDAAAVTMISDNPVYTLRATSFGTVGREHAELMSVGNRLTMNGRAIFNFAMNYVPADIVSLLEREAIGIEEIDRFVFHQGSKYIVDALAKRLKLDAGKVAFDIYEYGNTVSSTIPIILEKELGDVDNKKILMSGFGVGLSWASGILERSGDGS